MRFQGKQIARELVEVEGARLSKAQRKWLKGRIDSAMAQLLVELHIANMRQNTPTDRLKVENLEFRHTSPVWWKVRNI